MGIFTLKLGDIIQEMRLKDKNTVTELTFINKILQQIIEFSARNAGEKPVPVLVSEYLL